LEELQLTNGQPQVATPGRLHVHTENLRLVTRHLACVIDTKGRLVAHVLRTTRSVIGHRPVHLRRLGVRRGYRSIRDPYGFEARANGFLTRRRIGSALCSSHVGDWSTRTSRTRRSSTSWRWRSSSSSVPSSTSW